MSSSGLQKRPSKGSQSASVSNPLLEAVGLFKAGLTTTEQQDLSMQTDETGETVVNSIVRFTAEIDKVNETSRRSCVSGRLVPILESVRRFSEVADTFVSSHPEIAALVWGSLKLTIQIANNYLSFFDKLSDVLAKVGKYCPKYTEYRKLFSDSLPLQQALCEFYSVIVRFCTKALQHLKKPAPYTFSLLFTPFETEFKELEEQLREQHETVKAAITLASEQEHSKERSAAASHRKSTSLFQRGITEAEKNARERRLRKQRQEERIENETLLEKLSNYDHIATLRRIRKKRHGNTSSWLTQTQAFKDWYEDDGSRTLWLSGKVGSGKSVSTATMVGDILGKTTKFSTQTGFFFCDFADPNSLTSRAIIGSIIRQCLKIDQFSVDIKNIIVELFDGTNPDADDLQPLLLATVSNYSQVNIILDGFDECSEDERAATFKVLKQLVAKASLTIKLFLSSREEMSRDIRRQIPDNREINMNCFEARVDIPRYVEEILQVHLAEGRLVVGDPDIVDDIQRALVGNAHGMFLWVAFQIKDLCNATCDAEFRTALENLPKDLPQTYDRILSRVIDSGKSTIVARILRWIGVARRLLTLDELHEALAIDPEDDFLVRDRLINAPEMIVQWCGGLVSLNEEDNTVQLTHHSVRQFLISELTDQQFFRLHEEEDDLNAGIFCVTYLNFSDFERQLISPTRPSIPVLINPRKLANTAMNESSRSTKLIARFATAKQHIRGKPTPGKDVFKIAESSQATHVDPMDLVQTQYPFLAYAGEHWLLHSKSFTDNMPGRGWTQFEQLFSGDNKLAIKPWTPDASGRYEEQLVTYIVDHSHLAAAIQLRSMSSKATHILFLRAVIQRSLTLIQCLLRDHASPYYSMGEYLLAACENNHPEMVEVLLRNGASSQGLYSNSNQTPLLVVSSLQEDKGIEIVRLLLNYGADVNGTTSNAYSADHNPLLAATKAGSHRVVKLLLRSKATIDFPAYSWSKENPLLVAINKEFELIVSHLLEHGVSPRRVERLEEVVEQKSDVYYTGADLQSPLHVACRKGNLGIVRLLLETRIEVDINLLVLGTTALYEAASSGAVEVVEYLLAKGADVNISMSPLVAASYSGYVDVVEALLANGANLMLESPTANYGLSALDQAVEHNHIYVVKLLLRRGGTHSAGHMQHVLKTARRNGHVECERLLVEAGFKE